MNLYDISYCWKKAKPTCTYIVVVIFWRMIRPQKYDDHLGCHCMIVMCFHESHWCFAATSMLPEAWSFSMRELLSANGSKQGDSVKRIKIEHRKVIALMDSGTVCLYFCDKCGECIRMVTMVCRCLQCPRLSKIVTTWVPQVQETSSEPGSGLVPNTCVAYLIDVSRDQCLTSMFDQTVLSLLWDISDAECFAGLLDLWEHQGWRRWHQWRERRWGALVKH